MDFPEKLFEIIFNLLIQQNKRLLLEISNREKLSYDYLCRHYLPTRKQFRLFMNKHAPVAPAANQSSDSVRSPASLSAS